MNDLADRVERILKDEAFQAVLDTYRASLTATVMAAETEDRDRALALAKFHGLIGLESELRSEAFNATKEE